MRISSLFRIAAITLIPIAFTSVLGTCFHNQDNNANDGYAEISLAASENKGEWVHTWGGSDWDAGEAITVDASGNIYVAGYSYSFGAGNKDIVVLKYSLTGNLLWQKTWGSDDWDSCDAITADSSGNIYVTGSSYSFRTDNRDTVLLVLKYDTTGNLLWQKTWGGDNVDFGFGISADENENVYVTGWTESFGAGGRDVIILKYNSLGDLLWQKIWGGDDWDCGEAITVDASGNIYVTGYSSSFTGGSSDIVLLKYSAGGALLWQRTWGADDRTSGSSVTADGNRNVYVTGRTCSSEFHHPRIVTLKYSSDGNLLWHRSWNSSGLIRANEIVVDVYGSAYVVGSVFSFEQSYFDVILLSYDTAGNLLWQKVWGGNDWDSGEGATIDASGIIYIVGQAPNIRGCWQDVVCQGKSATRFQDSGLALQSSTKGSETIPDGITIVPLGAETTPDGTETSPKGVEDEGGGDGDVLVVKIDPSG